MGDFYELFFEDAEIASGALDIVLTKRGKHRARTSPCAACRWCAPRLSAPPDPLGHRVAVCEQIEDPAEAKKRGAKSVVKRACRAHRHARHPHRGHAARCRRATISCFVRRARRGEAALRPCLGSIFPPANSASPEPIWPASPPRSRGSSLAKSCARGAARRRRACFALAGNATATDAPGRDAFDGGRPSGGCASSITSPPSMVSAPSPAPNSPPPPRSSTISCARKSATCRPCARRGASAPARAWRSTRRRGANLELPRTLAGERSGSLFATIDRTVTAAGARLLGRSAREPADRPEGSTRGSMPWPFFAERPRCAPTARALQSAPDFARAMARLGLGRGGPRDLAALRDGLAASAGSAAVAVQSEALAADPGEIAAATRRGRWRPGRRASPRRLPTSCRCSSATAASSRAGYGRRSTRRGRCATRAGASSPICRRAMPTRQASALKIKHNNILGYYIEVAAGCTARAAPAASSATFMHRQTMAGAMRFTTARALELETASPRAADRALALELEIFDELAKACLRRRVPHARPRRSRCSTSSRRWPSSRSSASYVRPGGR